MFYTVKLPRFVDRAAGHVFRERNAGFVVVVAVPDIQAAELTSTPNLPVFHADAGQADAERLRLLPEPAGHAADRSRLVQNGRRLPSPRRIGDKDADGVIVHQLARLWRLRGNRRLPGAPARSPRLWLCPRRLARSL